MVAVGDQEMKVGVFSLWLLGVGSFIGGDFIGWPSVLVGGFGSGLISVFFFGFFFWMLGSTTGELSARFRDPGGTYMFSRRIFGAKIGSVVGATYDEADIIELLHGFSYIRLFAANNRA